MVRQDLLVIGRIVGLHGVKGWLKIESYAESRQNIRHYQPWYVRLGTDSWAAEVEQLQTHGKGLIVKFAGIDTRDSAAQWLSAEICIQPEQLAELGVNEYYWHQLIGLQVINQQGQSLGTVDSLFETGANDVLVVKQAGQETLIPYLPQQVIVQVDIERGELRVDWQAEDA